MTEFEKGYEQGYKDGVAGAALPNVNDNGDKIDGYGYAYKTDSRGEPYIHIDSVRSMLKKAADIQSINLLVKVEERVPNVSGNYLCYLATDEFEVLYFDRGIEDDEYNNDYPFGVWNTYPSEDGGECREWIEVLEVTHWMPLPKTPKE